VNEETAAAECQNTERKDIERQDIAPWPHAAGSALLSALGFLAFALVFMETGNFSPEARPFPRLIAVVGMFGAAIALTQSCRAALAVRRAERVMSGSEAGPAWRDIVVSYAGPPIYGVMLFVLGFWIASLVFLTGLLAVLGERRPVVIAAIAAGTLGAIYGVFELAFGIRLPGSMLMQALAN
jgi:hypothetical protein